MAKRSKVHPNYKTQYRVTNWTECDRGLVSRGSLTVFGSGPLGFKAVEPKTADCRHHTRGLVLLVARIEVRTWTQAGIPKGKALSTLHGRHLPTFAGSVAG